MDIMVWNKKIRIFTDLYFKNHILKNKIQIFVERKHKLKREYSLFLVDCGCFSNVENSQEKFDEEVNLRLEIDDSNSKTIQIFDISKNEIVKVYKLPRR